MGHYILNKIKEKDSNASDNKVLQLKSGETCKFSTEVHKFYAEIFSGARTGNVTCIKIPQV